MGIFQSSLATTPLEEDNDKCEITITRANKTSIFLLNGTDNTNNIIQDIFTKIRVSDIADDKLYISIVIKEKFPGFHQDERPFGIIEKFKPKPILKNLGIKKIIVKYSNLKPKNYEEPKVESFFMNDAPIMFNIHQTKIEYSENINVIQILQYLKNDTQDKYNSILLDSLKGDEIELMKEFENKIRTEPIKLTSDETSSIIGFRLGFDVHFDYVKKIVNMLISTLTEEGVIKTREIEVLIRFSFQKGDDYEEKIKTLFFKGQNNSASRHIFNVVFDN
jgi:hypothetical protein